MIATSPILAALEKKHSEDRWYRGDLSHLLRPHAQQRIYSFTKKWKADNPKKFGPIVWNCHRGLGKSFALLLFCIERCLAMPDQQVRYGAPTGKQCASFVFPNLRRILSKCPKELLPTRRGSVLNFRNPKWGDAKAVSTLEIISCKEDAESQRGPRSDVVVLDECRDIKNFSYIVEDIFGFHRVGRPDPLMILSSTPPRTIDHPWARKYLEEASRSGRYICESADKNEDLTKDEIEELAEFCGGQDTDTWKREALCQLISDSKCLIIPEFVRNEGDIIVDSWQRPKWYVPHVCVDFGFMDYTAVLFGYIDFLQQCLVIEDEIVVNYRTTGEIAALWKAKENALFGGTRFPVRRFGDNDLQSLHDLRRDHDLQISPADKYDKESACAKLRTVFMDRRIKIHRRCENLIRQLRSGIRDDKGNFERSETLGHCDAIAALIYLNRMINWQYNPIPPTERNVGTTWYADHKSKRMEVGNVRITREPMFVTRNGMIQ